MKVVVAKVDEVLYDGEAASLTVPGTDGEMTVLGHHEPLITTLKAGSVVVRTGKDEKIFEIQGGALEVGPHGATVIL